MDESLDLEEKLFSQAFALAPGERPAFLARACGDDAALRRRIEGLLRATERAGAFLDSPSTLGPEIVAGRQDTTDLSGARIGPYRLIEKIGEGGAGVVYEAEQEEPVRRRVALKLLKPGMDTAAAIARFAAERQAIALMEHPNIARVFDAGATEQGRLYFAMELVRGVRITDYCEQSRLPVAGRLDLFIAVCHAVQHAHQKGIIHRDLKPTNILVTLHDGVPVPKVIDFGIAKAVEGRLADRTALTEFEQVIGTPAYMSPEQANAGDLDTRSDIYSLGVVLYELLTGRPPFDPQELLRAGLNAARSVINEREVARPSERLRTTGAAELASIAERRGVESPQLVHAVRGDLDWIALKALAKDRQRRYPTANELAADVERHRRDEPVLARPPSAAYQAIKFTRRHRTAVLAAALVVGALLTGLALAVAGYRRAETARRAAVAAREEAVAVTGFFTKMLSYADPWTAGPDVSVKSVLDRAASTLAEDFKDRPAAELRIHDTIAETYAALGQYDLMAQHAARAAALARSVYGPDAVETQQLEASDASCLLLMGHLGEAEAKLRRALAVLAQRPGPDSLEFGRVNSELALCLGERGRFDEAVETELRVLAVFKANLPPNDWDIVHGQDELGRMLSQLGQCARARDVFREALATKGEIQDEQTRAQIMHSAAVNERAMGAYVRAEALSRRSYEMAKRLFGDDYLETQLYRLVLGDVLAHLGRITEARAEAEPSATAVRRLLGDGSPQTLRFSSKLSLALGLGGHPDEAIRQGRLAYERFRRDTGNGGAAAAELAVVLTNAGRAAEADQLCRETLADLAKLRWRNEYMISDLHRALAGALEAQHKSAEAEAVLLENHAVLAKLTMEVSDQLQLTVDALAALYDRTGQPQQAGLWRTRRPPEPAPRDPLMP